MSDGTVLPQRVRVTIEAIAAAHRLPVAAILGRRTTRRLIAARRDAMRAVRDLDWPPSRSDYEPHPSLPLIGRWFGRDHATVFYALRGGRPRRAAGG